MTTDFIFNTNLEFSVPVTLNAPAEGGSEKQQLNCKLLELSQAELEKYIGPDGSISKDADRKLLQRVWIGWYNLKDSSGKEVVFSTKNRDILLDKPYVRLAIATEYYKIILGSERDAGN